MARQNRCFVFRLDGVTAAFEKRGMEEQPILNLVYKLCKALEAEGLIYCHWKSNAALDRSASGDNDLDLLVSRADVQLFTDILCRLGFQELRASAEKQLPSV